MSLEQKFPAVVHMILINKDEIFGEFVGIDEKGTTLAIRSPLRVDNIDNMAFQLSAYMVYSQDQDQVVYFDLSHVIASKTVDLEFARYYMNMVRYLKNVSVSQNKNLKAQLKDINDKLEYTLSDDNIEFVRTMQKYNISADSFNSKPV